MGPDPQRDATSYGRGVTCAFVPSLEVADVLSVSETGNKDEDRNGCLADLLNSLYLQLCIRTVGVGGVLPCPVVHSAVLHLKEAPPAAVATHSRSSILMTWRDHAACLDEDPELFFPIGNGDHALSQTEKAKAVCRRCEVVDACLGWAIESGQDAGVWGGLSEVERRAIKRRKARARRADPVTPIL